MKKVILLIATLILTALTMYSYGQELTPKKGVTGKWGFVDEIGKKTIPFKYEEARNFSEELAAVKRAWWGFIDKTGKSTVPCVYKSVEDFSEGLAVVQFKKKYGFVDKTGKEVISLKYDGAWSFSEGLAIVQRNGKYGVIDKTGAIIVPIIYALCEINKECEKPVKSKEFGSFAQNYIEPKINEWQQKGEFEKTADWQQRVNENTRENKAAELLKDAEQAYIAEHFKDFAIGSMTLGAYDPDNEVYLIRNSIHGDWLVSVSINEAQEFKKEWNNLKKTPKYIINNDQLVIAEMTFTNSDGKSYKYNNQASLNYTIANIDYNFAPINVDIADKPSAQHVQQNISTVNINASNLSDVAKNIPTTNIRNDKTFAVIIANENYRRESQVMYAKNDGETFKKYCIQTLGLPEKNVHYTTNATLNDIRGEINWISNVASAFNGEANIIFYYAGHGIPDESSRTAYLLPVDGYGSDVTTGYKLDDLYTKLGAVPAKSVIIFMDACFSGAQRSGEMLASARGVAVRAKHGSPTGNMVVFSAAQGDETAYPYHEKGHGMFTYFLLKKLQDTKGEATLGELDNYITTNVKRESIVVNRKSQTPTVTHSTSMEERWKSLKLK